MGSLEFGERRGIPVVVTAQELGKEDHALPQQCVEALLQKGLFDQQLLLTDVMVVRFTFLEEARE